MATPLRIVAVQKTLADVRAGDFFAVGFLGKDAEPPENHGVIGLPDVQIQVALEDFSGAGLDSAIWEKTKSTPVVVYSTEARVG